jgi:hypothetical protein
MAAPEATEAPLGTESSTSTTEVAASSVTPSYLIYGWEGVTRVHDHGAEHLIAEPVRWAAEDGAGGIVFHSVAEQPGWAWLAGADRPTEIPTGFIFLLDGQPAALVSRFFDDMAQCENEDYLTEELVVQDLQTGDEQFLMCRSLGPDNEDRITSFGGGLFSWVAWVYTSGPTARILQFYDLGGNEITVEHNPFAESCAPCHLSARLSPDGALLAYSLWPTAYWEQPEPFDADYTQAYRDWYGEQQHIPTEIVVMDMATGVEVFRTDVVADASLTGFDGHIVTVTTSTGRELFDIETGEAFTAPPAMTEPAAFWTGVLASLDNETMDYDAAQVVAGDLAAQHDVATGVLWSDGFATLNPGYWAVFTGHFSTEDEALAHCEVLDADCYARYVATADIDGPGSYTDSPGFVLRQDGLRAVSFGDPVDDVMTVLTEHFGAPTNDEVHESPFEVPADWGRGDRGPDACHVATTGNVCFDYIRFVWWENVRLGVLFSDIEANPEVAPANGGHWVQVPPSFQGYGYRGHDEIAPLYTVHGITVGSTAEDLLSLGSVVSFNWTPCGGQVEFAISDPGGSYPGFVHGLLDDHDFEAFEESGLPNENAKVLSLNAGQSSSC